MNINYTPGAAKALTDEMKIKYKITMIFQRYFSIMAINYFQNFRGGVLDIQKIILYNTEAK